MRGAGSPRVRPGPLAAALTLAAAAGPARAGTVERPVLSGPEVVHLSDDGLFAVHYTLAGADALDDLGDDDPANGVPDPIDWVLEGLARVDEAFVVEDGWTAPARDEDVGGDGRLDVYLRGLDINGYAHSQVLPSGKRVCWIEIDPAMTIVGRTTFASIAGHEYHHCLQFEITVGAGSWIYEASATYAQYLLFDDPVAAIAREVLWQLRLRRASEALHAVGDRFEYAGMIWIKYLIDRAGGDRARLLDLWQAMADEGGWEAGHERALPEHFGVASLADAAAEFSEWNWFACASDDGYHYDPTTLGCGELGRVVPVEAGPLPATGDSGPVGRRGSVYVELAPDCASAELHVTVRPDADLRAQVLLEAPAGPSAVTSIEVAAGGEGTLVVPDWNHARRAVLIGTNLGATASFAWEASATGSYAPPAEAPPPVGLRVEPAETVALVAGETAVLAARADSGTCEDGRDATAEVTWRSSDDAVAAVAAGTVTAVGPGQAEVFAMAGEVTSNRVVIRVTAAPEDGCGCRAGGSGAGGEPGLVALLTGLAGLAAALRRRADRAPTRA